MAIIKREKLAPTRKGKNVKTYNFIIFFCYRKLVSSSGLATRILKQTNVCILSTVHFIHVDMSSGTGSIHYP
jgi:hypothetical protein